MSDFTSPQSNEKGKILALPSSPPISNEKVSDNLFSPRSPLFSPLSSITLKKAANSVTFCDRNFTKLINEKDTLSCRDLMRQLDTFHLHRPHPDTECKALNLPNHRINMHSLKEVMNLCGGLIGARFSSDDIRNLSSIAQQLEHLWFSIDVHYKEMTIDEHKLVLRDDVVENNAKIALYQKLAMEYLIELEKMQEIVRCKQLITQTEKCVIDVSNINQDPESQIGSPYPMWFVILKKKYESHSLELHQAVVRHAESPVVPANGVKFTLGRFCVFLSHCVEKTVELSPEEWDALQELYDASADSHAYFHGGVSGAVSQQQYQHYLSSRFFNFLKSMSELKSIPREEDAIKR